MELNELKGAVDAVGSAFEAFKAANDARLAEIEKKGSADVVTRDKLDRIETSLSKYESLNQKLVQAELAAKNASETAADLAAKLNRLGSGKSAPEADEIKARANDWMRAVVRSIARGDGALSETERKSLDGVAAEMKSLSLSPDTLGGYLAPTEYVREIIKGVVEVTPFRAVARTRQTTQKAIQLPKRTGTFSAQWVQEQGTRSETTGLTYGMDEIPTHEMFALVDITNQMLEDAAFNMEAEVRAEATEQFAKAEGAAFLSGSGVGRPFGFLNNASIATVNSGAAAALTADGLLSVYYGIKTDYARAAVWMLNRSTIGQIRRLKDGDGEYLWAPGLAGGVPNTINGAPYVEAADMPDVGASAKPVAFGDFRRGYVIVDRIAMEMLRDPYTQATSGAVRMIFRRRVGGQVVLPEAIVLQNVAL
jgi:HK97 family phage major capsid protein